MRLNISLNISIVPLFIILYFFFSFLNYNVHKKFINNNIKEGVVIEKKIVSKIKFNYKNLIYIFAILISGILLFSISNLLGNTLEILCERFYISQNIIGALLGFITSLPEFITFFESQKYYRDNNNTFGVVEATNNLLTSNSLNLFVIQTIGIIIKG